MAAILLTRWSLEKMADMLQTTFSSAYLWMQVVDGY